MFGMFRSAFRLKGYQIESFPVGMTLPPSDLAYAHTALSSSEPFISFLYFSGRQ